jgi:Tol biopolymer transport system component
MSRRAIVVVAAAVAVSLAGAAALLLSRDAETAAPGDLIAYSCREKQNNWFAICVVRSDGSGVERLTDGLATSDPTWSPDGAHIAFTRHEVGGEFTQSTQDDIYVMDADGSDLRQITPDREGQSSWKPAWSPDGRHIAFLRSGAVASSSATRYGDLYVMNVDGQEERRLTRGRLVSGPAWSPDGKTIAAAIGVRGDGVPTVANSDIYVLGAAGGRPRQLTHTPDTFESAPAWSPDGSRLAFARWRLQTAFDGKGAIYVMNADGSHERLLVSPQHFANGPYNLSWSPDGRSLAFETSSMLGCTSISTVELETKNVTAATSCRKPIEATIGPSWQPAAR